MSESIKSEVQGDKKKVGITKSLINAGTLLETIDENWPYKTKIVIKRFLIQNN